MNLDLFAKAAEMIKEVKMESQGNNACVFTVGKTKRSVLIKPGYRTCSCGAGTMQNCCSHIIAAEAWLTMALFAKKYGKKNIFESMIEIRPVL